MGLDYLNKKVWHPGSMKNIQKVWEAQQAQLQIVKKQKQRAKKLQDQQHNQEMKRIQVEAGLIPRSHLDRMDWMYDMGNKIQQQKTAEEYLTGKKTPSTETKHIFQEETTNKKCEDFILLHEDPLYSIQKEEMKARSSIMQNPMEMKKIIKEVEEDYLRMNAFKESKEKTSKKHKKHKKHKKSRKDKRRSSSSESEKQKTSKRKRSEPSRSSSSDASRSRDKKSKSTIMMENYLKQKFGGILKRDQSGKLYPDYGTHKKKFRTQMEMDLDEKRSRLEKMRQNAKMLKNQRDPSSESQNHHSVKSYEAGLAKIRNETFKSASEKIHRQRQRSPF